MTPARESYTEWRVVWPDGSELYCGRDEQLARRWATRTAVERNPTRIRDPLGHRSMTGRVERRKVVRQGWRSS